jgi:hypothetical protein
MRRPVFQIRVGSDAGCRVAGAGGYPICGPMDHNLQSGHECLGARQEHGGHARHYATRADSRQQLTRTTCAGAALHHRPIIGNQRARALPASPLAPPLDTRSQSCTPKLSRDASGMASPKGRAVHVLGVAHGSACSSRVGRANHRRCFMLHASSGTGHTDATATSSSPDHDPGPARDAGYSACANDTCQNDSTAVRLAPPPTESSSPIPGSDMFNSNSGSDRATDAS